MCYEKEKTCRIGEFLYEAIRMGYSYNDSYKLLLTSKQGIGILSDKYEYVIHHTGRTSAIKADCEYGINYNKSNQSKVNGNTCSLIAEFIQLCHRQYNIPYDKIFSKISLEDFMKQLGNVLGNYDHKLVREYIL
ncbi:MAG: hypothetical protein PUG10_07670 [Lachnospiraceae bacterium]|nr:hypothetical protein [Lachnospiraceae bacterium]